MKCWWSRRVDHRIRRREPRGGGGGGGQGQGQGQGRGRPYNMRTWLTLANALRFPRLGIKQAFKHMDMGDVAQRFRHCGGGGVCCTSHTGSASPEHTVARRGELGQCQRQAWKQVGYCMALIHALTASSCQRPDVTADCSHMRSSAAGLWGDMHGAMKERELRRDRVAMGRNGTGTEGGGRRGEECERKGWEGKPGREGKGRLAGR